MIKAVLKNGTILPLEPLPGEWVDGSELVVAEIAPPVPRDQSIHWEKQWEQLAHEGEPDDDVRLEQALNKAHQQAKDWMRRRMGRA